MAQSIPFHWITTGDQAVSEMLAAMGSAKQSIRLEMYIFCPGPSSEALREALVNASHRGVQVRVLLDSWGSTGLPSGYWDVLRLAGGQFRWFNPISLYQSAFRDHRKLLVCDEALGLVGGFNVGPLFTGDGVKCGWRDLGLAIRGPLVRELAMAFDEMFEHADFSLPPFARLRSAPWQRTVQTSEGRLLLSGPGRHNPLKRMLKADLQRASRIQIISAYFLPTWSLRRSLAKAARRGAQVQLILPGKSDVPLSAMAARSFYARLLRAGVEIFEYKPQILHAKLILIDDTVYAGSANLDTRSLGINYELTLRLVNPQLAALGRGIFQGDLPHCRRIDPAEWHKSRSLWETIKARMAYWILARLDPSIARYQWRKIAGRLKEKRKKAS